MVSLTVFLQTSSCRKRHGGGGDRARRVITLSTVQGGKRGYRPEHECGRGRGEVRSKALTKGWI